MGNIVQRLLHHRYKVLDSFQHPVEKQDQSAQFVLCPAKGNPVSNISGLYNGGNSFGKMTNRSLGAEGQQVTSHKADQDCRNHDADEYILETGKDLFSVTDLSAYLHNVVVRQFKREDLKHRFFIANLYSYLLVFSF